MFCHVLQHPRAWERGTHTSPSLCSGIPLVRARGETHRLSLSKFWVLQHSLQNPRNEAKAFHLLFFLMTQILKFILTSLVFFQSFVASEGLNLRLGGSAQDPVNVEKVLTVQHLVATADSKFELAVDIRPAYFVYSEKLALLDEAGEKLEFNSLTKSLPKQDPLFGDVKVFYKELQLQSPVQPKTLVFQSCWDGGVCYPVHEIALDSYPLVKQEAAKNNLASAEILEPINFRSENLSNSSFEPLETFDYGLSDYSAIIQNGEFYIQMLVFFIAGLLLAFTPCSLPILPIISGILIKEGKANNSLKKKIFVTTIYILSLATSFAFLGFLFSLLGTNLQLELQNIYVQSALSLVMILMAFGCFGFVSIKMPNSLENVIHKFEARQKGTYKILLLGFLSAVVAGPCVTPPLVALLAYLAQDGNPLTGSAALFFLGLGMGLPVVLIAVFSLHITAKMQLLSLLIKNGMGFVLLGMAVYFVSPHLDSELENILYACILILLASALQQIHKLEEVQSSNLKRVCALSFERLVLICAFILLVLGLLPLAGLSIFSDRQSLVNSPQSLKLSEIPRPQISKNWSILDQATLTSSSREVRAFLQSSNNPKALYTTADWCISCKELDRKVYRDAEKIKTPSEAIDFGVFDVTDFNDDMKKVLKKYSIIGPPTVIFFDAQGKFLPQATLVGVFTSRDFLTSLSLVTE